MFHDNMYVPPKNILMDAENPLYIEIGVSVLIGILEDNIEAIEKYLLRPDVSGLQREMVLDGLEERRGVLARLRAIDQSVQPNIYSGIYWAPDADEPMAPDNGVIH